MDQHSKYVIRGSDSGASNMLCTSYDNFFNNAWEKTRLFLVSLHFDPKTATFATFFCP